MKLSTIWLILVVVLCACGAVLFGLLRSQSAELAQLRAETSQMQAVRAELQEVKAERERSENEELLRLRKENEELLRLRNEVRQLRQDKQQLNQDVQTAQAQAQTAQQQVQSAQAQAAQIAAQAQTQAVAQLPAGMTPEQVRQFQARYGLTPATTEQQRATYQVNACINNLRQIDGAKMQWALENRRVAGSLVGATDIAAYLRSNTVPVCPGGGAYTINPVNIAPICNLPGHELPK